MPTVLFVDQDDGFRAVLAGALTDRGHRVVAVRDAETALFELAAHAIDVSLIDVSLPGLDGAALIREVRRRGTTPVIVLSNGHSSREDQVTVLAEADAHVSKVTPVNELDLRIRALVQGREGLTRQAMSIGDLTLCPVEQKVVVHGRAVHLDAMEMRLLMELVRSPMLVHTHDQLRERLFGPHARGCPDVLERRVESLRRVLEDDPRHPRRIVMIRGSGYCFVP